MPTYAEWVSTAAFGLSAASLIWQSRRAAAERPTLDVQSQQHMSFGHSDESVTFSYGILITNLGGKPTTIIDVGWERKVEPGGIYSIGRVLNEPALNAVHGESVKGCALPHRIEASDQAEWIANEGFMARWEGEKVRAVAYSIGRRRTRLERLISRNRDDRGAVKGDWVSVLNSVLTLKDLLAATDEDE